MRSQLIGKQHEDRVEALLREAQIVFSRGKQIRTTQGVELKLDFWIPATNNAPPVVLECKNFGVDAKSKSDSRRRKVQEALWLLIQVRRHCAETKDSRIVLVTGKELFLDEQKQLLHDELGSDFHVVSVEETEQLKSIIQA